MERQQRFVKLPIGSLFTVVRVTCFMGRGIAPPVSFLIDSTAILGL